MALYEVFPGLDGDESIFQGTSLKECKAFAKLDGDCRQDGFIISRMSINRHSGEVCHAKDVYEDFGEWEAEESGESFYDRMSAAEQYQHDRNVAESERLEMWRNEQ